MRIDLSAAWRNGSRIINSVVGLLPNILIAILIVGLFVVLASLSRTFVQRIVRRSQRRQNLGLLLGRLTQALVFGVGILIAFSIVAPSFQAGDVIKMLGIGGVAIGFAFQNVLQNFLAGILLLLHEPFHIGDQIVIKDFEGTVEDIQARATLIRTYDSRRIVIPNADLFTNAVEVNTAFERRRSQYDIGIGYGDDIEEAQALMLQAMQSVEGVIAEPRPETLLVDLGDYSVKIRAWWWTDHTERIAILRLQSKVIAAIRKKLTDSGIDLPYPTQQVLFHDQTEEFDGDRSKQREGWAAKKGETYASNGIAAALRQLCALRR